MSKTLELVSEVSGTCPCGKKFEVCKEKKTGSYCVTHELPMCKEFKEKEVEDYLHWVNVMYGEHN